MDQPYDSEVQLTPNTYNYVRQMSGWIKFVAIVGIVFASICLLMGVISLLGTPIMGLLVLIIGGVVMYMMNVLLKSGNGFGRYSEGHNPIDLEYSVNMQKTYWTFVGIFSIIGAILQLALTVLAFNGKIDLF